ncbi:MAG: 30S ribosomal protein S9 [Candidatus Nanoarchaeia archaeon]|nr:30S ribosomal protein S9 [Candidatus Haiyanarchaeum thermophilum]MCW1302895.1 30S ribosomal protein S9 [Candidatus Haiyanarchaeum thermophilum]MCW1303574.1 30S ribosomal protein S9 [Candidatus Haiyanarchaeum thermophilum]MCW1306256.1 30S ribosomal protein S9 [Candidatus Haiyanarchaeum thermophilum]MCW1307508.1 30S ribosomal protein S9 [Candidatus Haiyanarchaeum thermophilum]
MKKKVIIAVGKRKTSIAKAYLTPGKGIVRINSLRLDCYPELIRLKIAEPLILADKVAKKVNIKVNVEGGGIMSQAEAARIAIARAILEYSGSDKLKQKFLEYDRHLLVADVRRTEPQKPYYSAARRGRQTSKR